MGRQQKESRDLSSVEAENAKLKKQVSRLRKKLQQYQEVTTQDMDEDVERLSPGIHSTKEKCPACESKEVVEFEVAGRYYKLCKNCKWRKPIKR